MKIDLVNVSKAYGQGDAQFWALKEATISATAGDFISIVGPSGSGKSTMLHILGCLDKPTAGDVLVDGQPVGSLSDRQMSNIRRDHIGFVFQQYFLNASMTTLQNVLLPMQLAGVSGGKAKAAKALETVGLGTKLRSYPSELSGGEQQRVAIARALANEPSIVLADEPTGSLDSKTGQNVLDMLTFLNAEQNLGVVIVTHDEAVAQKAKNRIHVLDGRIS
ncbi:MAG: ABC transporter ATP-binding protein [Candidatus Atribacteria bacterium]|nr:MAG: ABC transporter ATP-binding protein [Candidatus Atribacteria bacterium]